MAVATVVVEVWTAGPLDFGEYHVALLAWLVSDVLPVGLLALLVLRPIRDTAADRMLTLGALLLSVAVVYRLAIEFIHWIRDSPVSRGLPPPPYVEPLIVVTCMVLGTWLLVFGLTRLTGTKAAPSRRSRAAIQASVAVLGAVAILLVLSRAAFSNLQTYPDPLAENGSAGIVTALTVLAWTALAVFAVGAPALSRGHWLLSGGATLILVSAGLDAFTNLIAGSFGPPRTWFPSLLAWHDAYVYVAVLNALGWVALFFAFVLLARPMSRVVADVSAVSGFAVGPFRS